MKKFLFGFTMVVAMLVCVGAVHAQGGAAKTGPDATTLRDPDLEKDSVHNLEVARNYFRLKKAYVAALKRCEEIIAGNPNFANLDEVLFIAGKSASLLADGKGKQKADLYVVFDGTNKKGLTPDEFRNGARSYFIQLINEHPQSKFRPEAEAELQSFGPAKQ